MHSKKPLQLSLLLFLASLSFAAVSDCGADSWLLVPAVFGDNKTISTGELVNVSLFLGYGNGNITITNIRHVGDSTLISARDALRYSFYASNKSFGDCNAKITMEGDEFIGEIEGPSAGLGFAVLGYAALNGLSPRRDATITGGITARGNAIAVGGLYEKAMAAAKRNFTYFVSPPLYLFEKILLIPVEQKYGLQIIETRSAKEATDFFLSDIFPEKKNIEVAEPDFPNVTKYDASGIHDFRFLSEDIVSLEHNAWGKIPSSKYTAEMKRQFEEMENRSKYLIQNGYYFTAANDAFNAYIDASAAGASIEGNALNIGKKKNDIRNCINSLPILKKTAGNYELAIGADLRKAWALDKLSGISQGQTLREELYSDYHELMYGDGWCNIALSMSKISNSQKNSQEVNERDWQAVAENRIAGAEALDIGNEEWLRHLRTAKLLYDSEKYGAAAMDATFAIAMTKTDREVSSGSLSRLVMEERVLDLKAVKRTSLWGQVYLAHGIYLSNTNTSIVDAYRMLAYARALDELNNELRARSGIVQHLQLSPPSSSGEQKTTGQKPTQQSEELAEVIRAEKNASSCPVLYVLAGLGLFQGVRIVLKKRQLK